MKKARIFIKLLYSIICASIILVLIFGFLEILKVKTIETTAGKEDMEGFPNLANQYIFALPENQIKSHFTKNPAIKNIYIKKIYPNTVRIDITYRKKIAQVISIEEVYISDENGVVFEKTATVSGLPKLMLNYNVNLGTNITQNNVKVALKVVNIANSNNLQFIEIVPLEEDSVSLITDKGIIVVIDTKVQPEDIVSSLQMILKRFTIEGKSITKIDLRFEKPVINF